MLATRSGVAARAREAGRSRAVASRWQHVRTVVRSASEYDPEGYSVAAWAGLSGPVPKPYLVPKKGMDLLHEPLFNKGVRFPMRERDRLSLRGLLPPKVLTTRTQVDRFLQEFRSTDNMMAKYNMLSSLQDRNETLFFKVLAENITECAPVVYTPTVGEACQKFSAQFRRPRGMFFSAEDRGEMASMLCVPMQP